MPPSNLEVDVSELPQNKQLLKTYRFLRVYDKYLRVYNKSIISIYGPSYDFIEADKWERRGVDHPSLSIDFIYPPIISKKVLLERSIPPFFVEEHIGSYSHYYLGMARRTLTISKETWKVISKLRDVRRRGCLVYYVNRNVLPNDTALMGNKPYVPRA